MASAQVGAVDAVVTAPVPVLHLGEIQSGGVAAVRRAACPVLATPGAVHVLLAAVLLAVAARSTRGMKLSLFRDGGKAFEHAASSPYSAGPTLSTRYVTGSVWLALAM